MYFTTGLLVGLSTEYATDVSNECLADSAAIIISAVNTYEYMNVYIESGEEDNVALAYALTYMIDGFEKSSTIDCSTLEDELNDWLTGGSSSAPAPIYKVD